MTAYPKISVVTICLNSGKYLEMAICSVLDQGYPNLEYIVIDGGSTDGSIEIIKRYQDKLAYWVSEPDEGPVFALQKGLAQTTGDIMAWLNADDYYHYNSLYAVAKLFNQNESVQWIMGQPTWFNQHSLCINEHYHSNYNEWRHRYLNNENIRALEKIWSKHRYYYGNYMAIQQESTFWRRELWEKAGGRLNLQFKMAYDMELWCRFFRHEKLHTANVWLAGFRFRFGDQLSIVHYQQYINECRVARQVERERLSILQKANSQLRCFSGKCLKACIYFNLPLAQKMYRWVLHIPQIISLN